MNTPQAPQDSFLLLLVLTPFYLSLAGRSFEYRIAKNNVDVKIIEIFLSKLNFPLRLIFNSKRWYGYIFTFQIDPNVYFPSLYMRIGKIRNGMLYLLFVLVLGSFGALLTILRQTEIEGFLIALIAFLCHIFALWLSWNFGSKLDNRAL